MAVTKKLIEQGRIPRDESIVDQRHRQRLQDARGGATAPSSSRSRIPAAPRRLRRALRKARRRPTRVPRVSERHRAADNDSKEDSSVMVQVRIPTPLRKFTGGAEEVDAEGATRRPRSSTTSSSRYPGIKERICDERRPGAALRQHLRERRRHPLPPATSTRRSRTATSCRSCRRSPAAADAPAADRAAATADRRRATRRAPPEAPSVLDLDRQHAAGRDPQRARRRSPAGVRLFAKLEGFNPGGSVKDRAGAADGRRRASTSGALRARQDDPRLDVRQHRHRARHDRRGARLSRRAGDARAT